MPCSSQTISEVLPEIHTVEKFDFLRSLDSISINLMLFNVIYLFIHFY